MNGIIVVDKPAGITSFDVVSRLRKITGERKIGHAGTLDPMATGVLPVFLGFATKAIALLPSQDKRYEAGFRLGITTDTGDITGRVLTTSQVNIDEALVAQAAAAFSGEIEQVPPMYSAIRQNGHRLYELARRGEEVERQPRSITVYGINLTQACPGCDYELEVFCSKGTYIRTLITDIGGRLGCGAVMTSLRRTYASGFAIGEALTLEQIAAAAADGDVTGCIKDIEAPFLGLCEAQVTVRQAERFRNGGALALERLGGLPTEGLCRVKEGGGFVGLGEVDAEKQELRVRCLFQRSSSASG